MNVNYVGLVLLVVFTVLYILRRRSRLRKDSGDD